MENDVETFREIVTRDVIGEGCRSKKLQRSLEYLLRP
jgi:hypothetical protein